MYFYVGELKDFLKESKTVKSEDSGKSFTVRDPKQDAWNLWSLLKIFAISFKIFNLISCAYL